MSKRALVNGAVLAAISVLASADQGGVHVRIHGPGWGRLPVSFLENHGQLPAQVAYYIQSPKQGVYFKPDGHLLRMAGSGGKPAGHTVSVELVGARTKDIVSLQRTNGTANYFKGPSAQWKTGIPIHSRIGYVEPWPGIDLTYAGTDGRLESIYQVRPHADPANIRLRYAGHLSLRIDGGGNLVYGTTVGEITETAPVSYQEIAGRRVSVQSRYKLLGPDTVGFEVAAYDTRESLVIDPTLIYAGFIGGSGWDVGYDIAVDSQQNVYVTGLTGSSEASFPVAVGPDVTSNGGIDAFVAKVNAAGTALEYLGYIGGTGDDYGTGIAIDEAGNAYISGTTTSSAASFPVLTGPDLSPNGIEDAFVAKVDATGTHLVYAGYVGGNNYDSGSDIALDPDGNAYIVGYSGSWENTFPVAAGPDVTHNGGYDAFVAKVNAAGTALAYAGYIGGTADEYGWGISVDAAGNAYVTGQTGSSEATFPVATGPDLTWNGDVDAFIAKVNPAGTALDYAGYLGGAGEDVGRSIAQHEGIAHVAGRTASTEATFPAAGGPDSTFNGLTDAFVAAVSADGTALNYAGYIGGAGDETAFGIAVAPDGAAHLTGKTASAADTFPASGGPDVTYNGSPGTSNGFVARVRSDGSILDYAGYVGASVSGNGIAVDTLGNAYITGGTNSATGFPATVGPDLTFNGGIDAFVAKVGEPNPGNGSGAAGSGGGGVPPIALLVLACAGMLRRLCSLQK